MLEESARLRNYLGDRSAARGAFRPSHLGLKSERPGVVPEGCHSSATPAHCWAPDNAPPTQLKASTHAWEQARARAH